jgi:hypothetical protein
MHPVTSWRVNTIKVVTQELPKASEVRVPPYCISHPSEPNLVLSVKLQGGNELLDQPWTIVLLDDHNLVQPHILSDPQKHLQNTHPWARALSVYFMRHTLVKMGA